MTRGMSCHDDDNGDDNDIIMVTLFLEIMLMMTMTPHLMTMTLHQISKIFKKWNNNPRSTATGHPTSSTTTRRTARVRRRRSLTSRNPSMHSCSIWRWGGWWWRWRLTMFWMKLCVLHHLHRPHHDHDQEMRPVVQAECTLKESAAINQILGRRVSNIFMMMINLVR